jgi:TRAP-type transport system periplasmic protein
MPALRTLTVLLSSCSLACLTLTACGSGSGGGGGGGGGGAKAVTFGGSAPAGDPVTDALAVFATDVKGSGLTVKTRPSSQLGPSQTLAQDVKNGTVQMGTLSPADMSAIDPEIDALDLPFEISTQQDVTKVYGPGGTAAAISDQLRTSNGMRVLGWLQSGFVDIITKDSATDLGGLKGLRLRAQPDGIQPVLYSSIGAQPTSMDFTEVFTSLQTGTLDGFGDPPAVIASGKFGEVAKHFLVANPLFNVDAIVINDKFYSSLSSSQQKAVQAAATKTVAKEWTDDVAAQNAGLAALRKQGVQVTTMSAADRATWQSKLASLYAKWQSKYPGLLGKLGFTAS